MAIVANEIPNVRYDLYAAERAKTSNDAQMITLGSQYLGAEFNGGRSAS